MYITSKRIELESPACSGFEENSKSWATDFLAQFVTSLSERIRSLTWSEKEIQNNDKMNKEKRV